MISKFNYICKVLFFLYKVIHPRLSRLEHRVLLGAIILPGMQRSRKISILGEKSNIGNRPEMRVMLELVDKGVKTTIITMPYMFKKREEIITVMERVWKI